MLIFLQPILFIMSLLINIACRVVNYYFLSLKRSFNSAEFSYDLVKSGVVDMLRSVSLNTNIEIKDGSFYRFDRIKQDIVLKNKQYYSVTEAFICFHEVGHCIESNNVIMNKIYRFIEVVTVLNLLLFMPFSFIYGFVLLINYGPGTSKLYVVFIVSILMMFIKLVSIPYIEIRANIIAKGYMVKKDIIKLGSKNLRIIDLVSAAAILEQMSIDFIFFISLLLIFYVNVFVKIVE